MKKLANLIQHVGGILMSIQGQKILPTENEYMLYGEREREATEGRDEKNKHKY